MVSRRSGAKQKGDGRLRSVCQLANQSHCWFGWIYGHYFYHPAMAQGCPGNNPQTGHEADCTRFGIWSISGRLLFINRHSTYPSRNCSYHHCDCSGADYSPSHTYFWGAPQLEGDHRSGHRCGRGCLVFYLIPLCSHCAIFHRRRLMQKGKNFSECNIIHRFIFANSLG